MSVLLHADDYGYNKEVSKDILDCFREGTLHGISIMPNSPDFVECMEMLSTEEERLGKKLSKTIHFCISEGPCLSNKEELKLLVNERGMFKLSFFKFLMMSLGRNKKELKKELKLELRAQLEAALPYQDVINADSHVHYHMIPLVLKSLLEVIEESGKSIEYIRIPAEPIGPFIKHKELWNSFGIVNIVKNVVLNFLRVCDARMLRKYKENTAIFFGIVMSGHMDIDRVRILLPDFIKIAEKKKMDLEVLAHPGMATGIETVLDPLNDEYAKAPLSKDRHVEKNMFMEITI